MSNVSPEVNPIRLKTPFYKTLTGVATILGAVAAVGLAATTLTHVYNRSGKKSAEAPATERILLIGRAAVPQSCFEPGQSPSNPTGSCATAMATYGRALRVLTTPSTSQSRSFE
jgi:hypothetical protein